MTAISFRTLNLFFETIRNNSLYEYIKENNITLCRYVYRISVMASKNYSFWKAIVLRVMIRKFEINVLKTHFRNVESNYVVRKIFIKTIWQYTL